MSEAEHGVDGVNVCVWICLDACWGGLLWLNFVLFRGDFLFARAGHLALGALALGARGG